MSSVLIWFALISPPCHCVGFCFTLLPSRHTSRDMSGEMEAPNFPVVWMSTNWQPAVQGTSTHPALLLTSTELGSSLVETCQYALLCVSYSLADTNLLEPQSHKASSFLLSPLLGPISIQCRRGLIADGQMDGSIHIHSRDSSCLPCKDLSVSKQHVSVSQWKGVREGEKRTVWTAKHEQPVQNSRWRR